MKCRGFCTEVRFKARTTQNCLFSESIMPTCHVLMKEKLKTLSVSTGSSPTRMDETKGFPSTFIFVRVAVGGLSWSSH